MVHDNRLKSRHRAGEEGCGGISSLRSTSHRIVDGICNPIFGCIIRPISLALSEGIPPNQSFKMSNLRLCFLAASASLFCLSSSCLGDIFQEIGDAGDRPEKALVVPPGVNRITGSLKPGSTGSGGINPVDVDLYIFSMLSRSGRFEIRFPSTSGFDRPGLILFYKTSTGYIFLDLAPQSPILVDATLIQGALQGTFCLAVGDRSMIPIYADGKPFFPFVSQGPIVRVGVPTEDPDPTTGQSYEIFFNFRTEVTGVNLTVGDRFSPLSQRGVTMANNHGKGQTISVSGRDKAFYKFQLHLHDQSGPTALEIVLPGSLELRRVWNRNEGKNVTASFLAGRYFSDLEYGNLDSFTAVVGRDSRPTRRFASPSRLQVREKVYTRAFLDSKPQYRDVVGTVINLRP